MPVMFVQVGTHWINLELVTSVELVPNPDQPTQFHAARVHYTTGKSQDFKVPVDVQTLADFLRAHKAP